MYTVFPPISTKSVVETIVELSKSVVERLGISGLVGRHTGSQCRTFENSWYTTVCGCNYPL